MTKDPELYDFTSSYTIEDIAKSNASKNLPENEQVTLAFDRTNIDGKLIVPLEGVIQTMVIKTPGVTSLLVTPRGERWELYMITEGQNIGSGKLKREARRRR